MLLTRCGPGPYKVKKIIIIIIIIIIVIKMKIWNIRKVAKKFQIVITFKFNVGFFSIKT